MAHEPSAVAQKKSKKETAPLNKKQLASFRELLETKRTGLLSSADGVRQALNESNDKLPDEVDLATAEYEAAFEYRLRDRDKFLLKKITKALQRIDEGEYDECESCGGTIAEKRLLARPEATLCIVCKEEQEHIEKGYLKKRELRTQKFDF